MEHPTRNDGRRQASTALLLGMRMRQGEPHNMQTGGIADLSGYGTTDSSRLLETHVITENNAAAYEIADDSNPVSAYFEILSIRRLLLEHVDVVLSPGQIHTPDVQLNLVSPLWQATRERCGVWRRGDMRHSRRPHVMQENSVGECGDHGEGFSGVEKNGGPLASAAILYASLANRDYFLILASAGQSQAELHGSRAEVAESLAILCAKALHKLGNRALINALCVKYTPIDTDGLHAEVARVLLPADNLQSNKVPLGSRLPIRGDRHMSLLSPDQRVRVYRLGRAGHLKDSAAGTPIRTTFNEATTTRGETGFITPFRELAKDYLSGGSRIVAEHAIEVAIRSEAKRFTAQTLVGEVVYMLWDGTLHWKGFHCTSLLTSHNATNTTQQQCNSTLSFLFERRGSVGSDTEACEATEYGGELDLTQSTLVSKSQIEGWLIKTLAPLRIPMVESALTMLHNFFFLTIYTVVSLRRQEELSIEEVIMHVCALAYIADETRQCMENGVAVYLKSVWNVLDVTIYTVFTAFFCLRIRSLFTGSEADLDKAYDVLALNASMLWPRLFAVLDQFEFCGTIIIQVRRIIAGTSLFFALLLAMTMGFFQTFYALSRKHNELDAKNIWGLMTRIFFGSALLGWDQADLFGPYVGYLVMATYIGVSMLILYNILIGVINQCMMEIERNAAEEFRFAYTMRVAEYVSARQTYPCVPPLNLLQIIIFWPLRKTCILSIKSFILLRSMVLFFAYMPHLLLYAGFRHCYRWWRERSGTQNRALRTECHLAEKELALIKICKDDIDEFAFSGSTDDTASEDGSSDIGYTAFGNSGGGESQTLGNGWSRSSVPVIATDSCLRNLITSPTLTIGTNASNSNTDSGISGRWASLMNAWRSRNNHAKNLSPQSPRWSSTDALDSAAHINPQPADALHAIAEKENHIQTTKKLTQLQTQVTEIDKKLTNIARLLQPVTDRD